MVHHPIASEEALRCDTTDNYGSEPTYQSLAARLHYASSEISSTDSFYTACSFSEMPSVSQPIDTSIFSEHDIVIV